MELVHLCVAQKLVVVVVAEAVQVNLVEPRIVAQGTLKIMGKSVEWTVSKHHALYQVYEKY